MSNGNDSFKNQLAQIIRRAAGAGALDQAPLPETEPLDLVGLGIQEGPPRPQEAPSRQDQLAAIIRRAAARRGDPIVGRESGRAGLAKGFAEGITTPLTLLGLDVDLPPSSVGPFTREASVRGRLLGNVAGVVTSTVPFFLGARAALSATGLAASLTETQLVMARGALGFGTFNAATAEELKDVPARFLFGAGLGAAADLALLRASDAAKVVGATALGGGGVGALTATEFEDIPERFAIGAAIGAAAALGLVRTLRGRSVSQLVEYQSPRSAERLLGPARGEVVPTPTTPVRPRGPTIVEGPAQISPAGPRQTLPAARVETRPDRLLTGGRGAIEEFVAGGKPLRNGPFYVTPTGVVFDAGPVAPFASRAAELVGNDFLPRDISFEGVQEAMLRSARPVTSIDPGAGEAFLYAGEAASSTGKILLTSKAGEPPVGRPITTQGEPLGTDIANVQNLSDVTHYGTRELPNGFNFPITRAFGKPVEYDPSTGMSLIRLTPPERAAFAQAFEATGLADEILAAEGDLTVTAPTGQVIRDELSQALLTKFNEIENLAELGETLPLATAIDEFQALQLATSKFDVYQPPFAAAIEDLKAIKLIDLESARTRATRVAKPRTAEAGARDRPLEFVNIDADAFALEQSFTGIGEDTFGDAVKILAELGKNLDEQLEITVAKLHIALNNGGMSITSADPRGVRRIVSEIKRQLPEAKVGVYIESGGGGIDAEARILVAGPVITGLRALIKETLVKKDRAVLDAFIERGTTEDWQRIVDILSVDAVNSLSRPPILTTTTDPGIFGRFTADRPMQSTSSTALGPAIIEGDVTATPVQQARTLVHEYFHNMSAAEVVDIPSTTDIGFGVGGAKPGTLPQIFSEFFESATDKEWIAAFGSQAAKKFDGFSEIGKLAVWARGSIEAKAGSEVVKAGLKEVIGDADQFLSDSELIAMAGEMVFMDRPIAKTLAPRVTEEVLKWAARSDEKMQLILGDKRLARVGEILTDVAFKEVAELQTRVREFGVIKTAVTSAEIAEWEAHGFFPGMPIHRAGVWSDTMIAVRREGPNLIVRERWEDIEHTVPWSRLRGSMFVPSKALTDEGISLIRNKMQIIGNVMVPLRIPGTDQAALTRVGLKDIKIVDSVDTLRDTWAALLPARADEIGFMPDEVLFEFVGIKKAAGEGPTAIRHDDGMTLIFSSKLPEPTQPESLLPQGALEEAGDVGGQVVHLTPRQLVDSVLADGGLNARDRAFVADQVLGDITRDFFLGLPKEKFTYSEVVTRLAETFGTRDVDQAVKGLRKMGLNANPRQIDAFFNSHTLNSTAAQTGYRIREALDGKFLIETEEGLVAGVFDRAGAQEWVDRAGFKRHELSGLDPRTLESDVIHELGDASLIGTSGASFDVVPTGPGKAPARPTGDHSGVVGGGGSPPVRFGDTFGSNSVKPRGWAEQFFSSIDLLMPTITGMETMSLTIENTFGVPVNSELFEPLQQAVRTIDRIGNQPRAGFNGQSWNQVLHQAERLTFKISKQEDRFAVTTWIEALSKEEIASSLMTRPMNELEFKLSAEINRLGLAHEMPRLVSTHRLMKNLVISRKKFMKRYKSMNRQELSPEIRQRLDALFASAKSSNKNHTFPSLSAELNLNEAQARMIQMLEVIEQQGFSPDNFSLLAPLRHAAAENLPRGFKTMQDVIAKRMNFTDAQLELGRQLERFYDEAFIASRINPKRYLRGYFPHMRVFAREGILPNDPMFKNVFPKASAFAATKFRTGELDIYTREPLTAAVKHLRGLMMRDHFDPVLPRALEVLKDLEKVDPRSGRILKEYINELQGKSHHTFAAVQEAMESSGKAMGLDIDRNLARTLVNTLASLSHQTLIPFRAGLIARNYGEMITKIPPRVGGQNFVEGLRIALTKEGYEAARAAGAVTENVAPVMSSESVLGFDQTFRLSRRLQMVSDVGFRWYQKADDVARAAAFNGQRVMLSKAIDKYMKGEFGKGHKAINKMMEEGGVRTFNQIHQKQFEDLFRAGKIEDGKNLLGMILSRETIFRYGHANHPAGWGSVYGRLFGQFGTWSIQYKDFLIQGATRGTRKDKARFWLWHTAGNLGTLAGGAMVGLDLWAWVTFPALTYTGGPYADIAIDMTKLVGGNDREQAAAWRALKFQFVPTLSDPRAIWLPGSYAVSDLVRTFDSNPTQAFGFRFYDRRSQGAEVLETLGLAPQ